MNWLKTIAGAALLQAALVVPVMAGENLDAIKSSGVLKIGTEGTYAPFTYHDTDGKLVGFDVEIGEANRYDVVINQVGITDERKQKYDFSEPYIASKAVLIIRSDDDSIKGFGDLKGKTSAQSLTSNFGKLATASGAELVGTDGFDQSIQLVLTGRADATINDSLSYLDFKKHKPDAPVKIAAEQADADYSGIIFRKGDADLKVAIDKAIADIKADGTYQKIADKYFGADVSK
jgi:cystine transport system substrate-binding protein